MPCCEIHRYQNPPPQKSTHHPARECHHRQKVGSILDFHNTSHNCTHAQRNTDHPAAYCAHVFWQTENNLCPCNSRNFSQNLAPTRFSKKIPPARADNSQYHFRSRIRNRSEERRVGKE